MTINEAENRIKELKAAQSEFFKKKKADRALDALAEVREEMNALKAKLRNAYRGKEAEGIEKN